MNLLKNLFGKKEETIKSYDDFWNWFQKNEKGFFRAVKGLDQVEKEFFSKLSPKLKELRDGYYFVTGMCNENTAELIITADGIIKNIVFAEDLVKAAPAIDGWKFTALKPAQDIKDVVLQMAGIRFAKDNMNFYANEDTNYPDDIYITVVHNDYTENNKQVITNGTYIFLDNYLGELEALTAIDRVTVTGPAGAKKELIPIEKLKDFLIWREKEFIEKYEGTRRDTENDEYGLLEAKLKNGNAIVATINTAVLNWDRKASHPWVAVVEIKYDGRKRNGMPDDKAYKLLQEIEEKLLAQMQDFEGYINIGHQTADNVREIYFACKDFRRPSKELQNIVDEYSGHLDMSYDIYKDKYWQTFERFRS